MTFVQTFSLKTSSKFQITTIQHASYLIQPLMKLVSNINTLRILNKIQTANMNGFWFKGKLVFIVQILNTSKPSTIVSKCKGCV